MSRFTVNCSATDIHVLHLCIITVSHMHTQQPTIFSNYQSIQFFPHQFHDYLMSPEVGFTQHKFLGVPQNKAKGECSTTYDSNIIMMHQGPVRRPGYKASYVYASAIKLEVPIMYILDLHGFSLQQNLPLVYNIILY